MAVQKRSWKTKLVSVSDGESDMTSLTEAVRLLGKLGGHLARASDARLCTEVLWRGADIEIAYDLYY